MLEPMATGRPGLEESGAGGGGTDCTPQSRAKLPKLSLNKFDGDITKWTTFWDSYSSAIHTDEGLSEIEKFTYLQTLVDKSAKEAITGLALTAENYEQAVRILQKRFGNKQQIIHKHMDILLSVEVVGSPQNLVALRRLYDKIESNVQSLESLGVSPDLYGSLLSSVGMKKLLAELCLLISGKIPDEWSLPSILTVLKEELTARERVTTPLGKDGGRRTQIPTAAALIAGSRYEPKTCCYCQGEHSPDTCPTVRSVSERKQALKSSGRCYVCLRRGHLSRTCKSKGRCRWCNNRHHSSICEKGQGEARSSVLSEGSSKATKESNPSLNPGATPFSTSTSSTTCCCTGDRGSVMLQVAKAIVYNPIEPERRREVIILFDSGSQRSFVTETVSRALKVRRKGCKTMTIMTFGTEGHNQVRCDHVQIGVVSKDGTTIQPLSIPLICEPVTSPSLQIGPQIRKQLKELGVAQNSIQPDMLIGLDYYWEFMSGEVISIGGGPVAMYTRLGWVISGPVSQPQGDSKSTSLMTHVLKVSMSVEDTNRQLDQQLRSFWELESFGILDKECSLYKQFADIVTFRGDRYEAMEGLVDCDSY